MLIGRAGGTPARPSFSNFKSQIKFKENIVDEIDAADFKFEVEERCVDLKDLPLQQTLGQRADSDPEHKVILRPDTGSACEVFKMYEVT